MKRTYAAIVSLRFSIDDEALMEQGLIDRPADDDTSLGDPERRHVDFTDVNVPELLATEIASLGYTSPEVCDVHDETVHVRSIVQVDQQQQMEATS